MSAWMLQRGGKGGRGSTIWGQAESLDSSVGIKKNAVGTPRSRHPSRPNRLGFMWEGLWLLPSVDTITPERMLELECGWNVEEGLRGKRKKSAS